MVDIVLYISLIAFVVLTALRSRQKLDFLRHELFCLRYRLFNLALENNGLTFDDPVYKDMERTINSSIRFAHHMGFEVFAAYLTLKIKRIHLDENQDIYPSVNELTDSDTKNKLSHIIMRHKEILNSYISDKLLPVLFAALLVILLLSLPVLVILMPFIVFVNIVPKTKSIFLKIKSILLKLRETPSDMEKILYSADSYRNAKPI